MNGQCGEDLSPLWKPRNARPVYFVGRQALDLGALGELDGARADSDQAQDRLDDAGFSSSVDAQDRAYLALSDLGIHAPHRLYQPVGDLQTLDLQESAQALTPR